MTVLGDDVVWRSAAELAGLVRSRQVSAVDLVESYLARIDRYDGRLRAYVTVCGERARAEARQAEHAVTSGAALGPLHGVPFAVKDQLDSAGVATTQGSRLFAGHVPGTDATVVARLRAAGGILLGKLNLTEFALGGTIDPPYGQPRNPWNPDHDPGGSSSGSGIAAAAALAGATLGEDTGGSVRSPASWCGAVGLRPTWGLVSRHGCFPACPSMDTAGPLTRTVADAALLLGIVAGPDPGDPATAGAEVPDYAAALGRHPRGVHIAVIRELMDGAEPEVREIVLGAVRGLGGLGAQIEEVSLPLLPLAGATFMALCDSEAAGIHLPWLRTRPGDYDQGTRRRLMTAGLLPTALYHRAARARRAIRAQILAALGPAHLLLCPTNPAPAPLIARVRAPIASAEEAAARFFNRRSYTTPFSLAGVPAISLPCGLTAAGLPVGLQLAAPPFGEPTLLAVAHAYEATRTRLRPPLEA